MYHVNTERFQLHVHESAYTEIRDHYGFTTVWSLCNMGEKLTDFSEVPYPDMRALRYDNIETRVSPNPTWLDLWKYADQLYRAKIAVFGFGHDHMFIESFIEVAPGVYRMFTGN